MRKTVIMFPGQGAQKVGMLKELNAQYPEIQQTVEAAERVLNLDIRELMWAGPQNELDMTCNTQPIMLTAEVALFRILRKEGVEPSVLTGFSLGEWAAAVAGEMLSFDEALRLVCLRAKAMQEAVPVGNGGMAVIMGRGEAEVKELCASCGSYVIPANYNYPGQITVSGTTEAIKELKMRSEKDGFVFQPLSVSIPSHCKLMAPAADKVRDALREVEFSNSRWPILLNADNCETVSGEKMKQNLVDQMILPIRFEQSVRKLLASGIDSYIEAGPGKTLAGFVRKTAKAEKVQVFANRIDAKEDLSATLNQLRR